MARLPAGYPLVRGGGRAARRPGRPPGTRPGAQRGLPGRSVAALNGPPHARGELYDEGRTRGIDGAVNWSRLDAETRKMIESGLELEDRIEAA